MEHEHSAEAISERLSSGRRHSYLRDWVYGGIDGSVTTFAVVAGVVGAQLSPGVILVIGMANIFADGFSMAASMRSVMAVRSRLARSSREVVAGLVMQTPNSAQKVSSSLPGTQLRTAAVI